MANAGQVKPLNHFPSCGDHVQVTIVSYDYQTQTVSFKVVAVDLWQLMGTSYGTMSLGVFYNGTVSVYGPYNASGLGGATSPTITSPYATFGGNPVSVDVTIDNGQGTVYCDSYYGVTTD